MVSTWSGLRIKGMLRHVLRLVLYLHTFSERSFTLHLFISMHFNFEWSNEPVFSYCCTSVVRYVLSNETMSLGPLQYLLLSNSGAKYSTLFVWFRGQFRQTQTKHRECERGKTGHYIQYRINVRISSRPFSLLLMVLTLDGNSELIAHAWRKKTDRRKQILSVTALDLIYWIHGSNNRYFSLHAHLFLRYHLI